MAAKSSNRFIVNVARLSIVLVLIWTGIFSIYNITCIEPGFVGIEVKLVGEDKGVQDITVKTGYTMYNQWTNKIYEYPTSLQRKIYQDVTFQAKGGTAVSADMSVHYTIPAVKAPHVFVKLKGDKDVLDEFIFSCLRKVLQQEASELSVNDIYAV